MSEDLTQRRQQREFLFVFSAKPKLVEHTLVKPSSELPGVMRVSSFEHDEAKAVRSRLISELREFGC